MPQHVSEFVNFQKSFDVEKNPWKCLMLKSLKMLKCDFIYDMM